MTVGRIVVMSVVAALLLAASILPVVGITGIAVRDAANTFNNLKVGSLGAAPARSVLYDAEGQPITYFYPYGVYRVPVTLSQIAPVMRNAIVAIEDDKFYSQGALDPRGTLRALVSDLGGGQLQGASTIAQEYVKNVKELQAGNNAAAYYAAMVPNLQRKVQQLRMAVEVEHELTPQQLLDSYLNVVYFDNHAYGIEVASEVYFSKHASQLTLPEAALLAGIVQSPTYYDPVAYPANALQRRNEVLNRMWQLHYVSKAAAQAAEKAPLGLHMSTAPTNTGCLAATTAGSGFFCDYVEHVLQLNYPAVWSEINNSGGLAIHTTLNMQDQRAANRAVNYVQPTNNYAGGNPGHNADTEVMLQPGTGAIRAIAINQPYGPTGTYVDYAVNQQYGGDANGVQTGSSAKIFTIVTALKDGIPFGHPIKLGNPETIGPFPTCNGGTASAYSVQNAEAPFKGSETWQFNEATVQSVNTYFVNLEKQVGLCNVVKTAVDLGVTRADGKSLMTSDPSLPGQNYPAYDYGSFTLGSMGVTPMSMAAAYASLASRGMYCAPQAITAITVMATGKQLPVQGQQCRRVMSQGVADAANYLFQGVLTQSGGTAFGRTIPGHTAAGKTGTANNGYYAAFAGYTPTLTAYVSVFNPVNPVKYQMLGAASCYRDLGGLSCPGQMYGDNAPAATWEYSFLRAALGPDVSFGYPPASFFSLGNGLAPPITPHPPKTGNGGGGGGHHHGGPPGGGGPPNGGGGGPKHKPGG